jgi:Transposase DDE domain
MSTTPMLESLSPLPVRLEVVDVEDCRSVFLNGYLTARYPCHDKGAERVMVTQLAEVLPLPDREIAARFGFHPVTLSRLRAQVRSGGAAALLPGKTGPKGPHKVTAKLAAQCRALRQQGLSCRAIAQRVSRPSRTLSYGTVAALIRAEEAQPQVLPLPLEADESPVLQLQQGEAAVPAAGETKADRPALAETGLGAARRTRYAGALMLYPTLARLDLWGVFRSLGAAAGSARWCGWAQTVAAIVFCFALRFRSIEDWKNGLRRDLGVLLGVEHGPSVLTLRSKVKALAESVDPVSVSRELLQRYLRLEPVWEGLYYIDGYFCSYYGQHPTPQGWDAQRRLAVKGHTDVYLHDARGRVLFFFSQPLNDSLARALPGMVEEIRRAHGPGPFTVVFDRGGYSGKAFRFLQEQGIGWITYLKGRKARRRYPRERFRRGWFLFEGRRHSYRLMEKKTRVRSAGAIRTILFLGEEEQQIPVLTSLGPQSQAAKIVHCLRLRWRQENSFKFLAQNYAIEQIVQYGAHPETQDRLIPNSRHKALKAEIRTRTQQLQALEAQLGRALEDNDENRRRTARGLKIAHSQLRREIARKRQALSRLENRLRHTPAKISAQKVDRTRMLLREDRRLIVNALKLAAANAERMLARCFDQAYQCPKDAFSVFRALLQLPGEVRPVTADHLGVHLQRPDSEKVANALAALLADLNREPARMLGDGPILTFHLADVSQNTPSPHGLI